ncbi:MAG: hypothetical protein K9W44_10750 [Candidatus Lokiarchaeota archaeon]|nr:hypothetical protein [Candidatus Harpocratesius repetitus]
MPGRINIIFLFKRKMSNNIFNPPFMAAGDFDGDGRITQYKRLGISH